jgi:(p)ppGpp synthase/HD superfamily hydrolase
MFNISYGVGNTVTKSEGDYQTIGDVLRDANTQAEMRFDPAQVDARVNGQIVDLNTRVVSGMRIELIKKAGRKSAGAAEPLNKEQQLSPIGIDSSIVHAVLAHASAALEPLFKAVNDTEAKIRKEIATAQREVMKGFKPFNEFIERLLSQVVEQNYIDSVGSLTLPQEVREELELIASTMSEKLKKPQDALQAAEKAITAWSKSTNADLHMCVTIADQRKVLAKVLSSDPLKAWKFEA